MIQYDVMDLAAYVESSVDAGFSENVQHILVIPSNGFVKQSTQSLVMGCGFAKRMADLIPGLAETLGQKVAMWGNTVQTTARYGWDIYTLPVKPDIAVYDGTNCVQHMRHRFKVGDYIPGWACKAELELLRNSLIQLKAYIERHAEREHSNRPGGPISIEIYMPRPGCGAGELRWSDVKSVLEDEFDTWMSLHDGIFVHVCALHSNEFTI